MGSIESFLTNVGVSQTLVDYFHGRSGGVFAGFLKLLTPFLGEGFESVKKVLGAILNLDSASTEGLGSSGLNLSSDKSQTAPAKN
ncbi:hypothetical protein LJU02_09425 [Corynebacterium pseudotuberculosis]|uniref:Uncharacterized protein n=1 Tax=Corynebacterium pseudotuberculosis 258 TaxID=1168865 RepID=A0AAU8QGS4_CORPS|nr:hypothetical protein [Corynebacterium pseudotuberculosis]AEQ07374.1 hypothetical protein CPCIP5297_09535 [Corynebacterium pseudotuberculosis CIP 52.97]AFB73192.1 hypothetical protein CP316_09525 [Corynebacterium pseudotuberculosis 316]AFH91636.1 hypothetical protein CP31_09740 [Corynebacterium pseudotuberculosis 31]AFK17479.1 hypothetical protein CP258_09535 [Corynebacterium pseudotuberculosis 258]AKS14189.1 Hypothetical protein CpE19_1852 [Corynebacterium pseudotuberculosis]